MDLSNFKLLTDVFAIRCINDNVLVGMGSILYVFKLPCELKLKLSVLHPDKIHGIEQGPSSNNYTIFGEKSLTVLEIVESDGVITINRVNEIVRFPDWIHSVKWIESVDCSKLAILFAHNNVWIYDFKDKSHENFTCEEKCILYSGSIFGQAIEDLVIFSGTVFQEILIWRINEKTPNQRVLHRLLGHNGVIFSINFDWESRLLCSTSDDRTFRLWEINLKTDDFENAQIKLKTTVYGHSSRVWKAVIKKDVVISIGEDSYLCVWTLNGDLLSKTYAHQGAPIWSLDVSNDCIITGSVNGAISTWPLRNDEATLKSLPLVNDQKPKFVTFLDNGVVLVLKENDELLMICGNGTERIDLPKDRKYRIMQVSPCRCKIALATRDGLISIYKLSTIGEASKLSLVLEEKLMVSCTLSLHWLTSDTLLTCGEEGNLKKIRLLENGSINVESEHVLPSSRERWITAAVEYKDFIICGDRAGSIFVFKINASVVPVQEFRKIHGRLGVQSCAILKNNEILLTTGRDGKLRRYKLSDEGLTVLNWEKASMGWACGCLEFNDDFYIYGFREIDFVIHSTKLKRTLLSIPCGNGHRSWDFKIDENVINFIYIRDQQIFSATKDLSLTALPSLMDGYHSKEIYCIKSIPVFDKNHILFLSGGEDCSLRIGYTKTADSECNNEFVTLAALDGHNSSIRSIAVHNLEISKDFSKNIVFSCGGRAQIKVWQIDIKTVQNYLKASDVLCTDLNSHMLYGFDKERKKPWREEVPVYSVDAETRYMDVGVLQNANDLSVFLACSDGYIRIFSYDIPENSMNLLHSLNNGSNHCILKLCTFKFENKIILIAMSTDGFMTSYSISMTDSTDFKRAKILRHREKLHKSGINSYDILKVENDKFLLATGGDDNAINLLLFKLNGSEEKSFIEIISKSCYDHFHSCQVTGLKFGRRGQFYSTGIDQVINKYDYSDDASINVSLSEQLKTPISDAQGLELWINEKSHAVTLCKVGRGLQIIHTKCSPFEKY